MHTVAGKISLGLLIASLVCQSGAGRTISSALPHNSRRPELEQDSGCTRGAAEPVVNKAVFPHTTFRLQPDKRTGIETVTFSNGDKVTIRNGGCEYYELRFRFETSRFAQPTTALEPWFRTAATLMTGMLKGLNAPIDIGQGVRALRAYTNQGKKTHYRNLALGKAIFFGPETMRSMVVVDHLEKGAGKKRVVEVRFAIGPL
jgi:hypothetical protein